ncbi:hypothetical protein PG993_008342 [Apiospora rasikravindrae]|uniref:Uncharacterized protein n=1 Tax=Apiospora rasikravindrae TaxID=990691 RepID=A0ABR1T032_9PEZI
MNIDLNYESPLARLELTPFLYGRGTALAPITEHRSIATLRNGIVSTPDLEAGRKKARKASSNNNHKSITSENCKGRSVNAQEESPLLSRSSRLRRQQSFSLDSGKSHILQTQQQYHEQALFHRNELTSAAHGGSSSSFSSAAARRHSIDTARILAEIKSYPHMPPFSPHTQAVTPPEYQEWALSHPWALTNPVHQLQRRGEWSTHRGHNGDLTNHPFLRGTRCFAPPTITATPPDTTINTQRPQQTPTTATGLRHRLGKWKSMPAALGNRGSDTEHDNNSTRRLQSPSSSTLCLRCDQPITEPWKL